MADHTTISWSDATWNPITGCRLASEGCRHCYAASLAAMRLKNHESRKGLARFNADGVAKFTGEVRFNTRWIDQPIRWTRPRRIFVCAHADLFYEEVPEEWIDRVFEVMQDACWHDYQVLTKRAKRMRDYVNGPGSVFGSSSQWFGVSAENNVAAEERLPDLVETIAPGRRWVSAEPLLGPLNLRPWLDRLDWVVVGCESGPHARPFDLAWARDLRDQCFDAGVPFFVKQLAVSYRILKNIAEFPHGLQIQQWPEGMT